MKIVCNYGVANCVAFRSIFGKKQEYDPTEMMPWGRTRGEYEASKREAEAYKRLIQYETIKNSSDPHIREHAKDFGKNPWLDEYYTEAEFRRYHTQVMAERAAKERELEMQANKKNFDGERYDIKDNKGRVIERGVGENWTEKYKYDMTYHMDRFGEHYDMHSVMKILRPDGSYKIKCENSNTVLEEKFPNESIEYLDNCTGHVKSVRLPDNKMFATNRFLNVKQTENSRQYFDQYDDKNVKLEVFNDGSYEKY